MYTACTLCPRTCKINRLAGQCSFCGETADIKIASACLHFGEEPLITGQHGSGTVFISGCNLGCSFCQNHQISREGMGAIVSIEECADIFFALHAAGAENINIVTGSQAAPALAESIMLAKKRGLTIPFCWNSSAYESPEVFQALNGLIDIWLADLKSLNPLVCKNLFQAKNYPETACNAIKTMLTLSPLVIQDNYENKGYDKMLSGVIIRHLILPGRINDTKNILEWLKLHCDGNACISIMSQFTPVNKTENEIIENRFVSDNEFAQIKKLIYKYKFEYLFYQELVPDDSWLPDFNRTQPFSNELAKPVWHWKKGFV